MSLNLPNKKVINWHMYDRVNSVYNRVITTTFFPLVLYGCYQGYSYPNGEVPSLACTSPILYCSIIASLSLAC